MEGVQRAFLESYIAVPVRLVEECPPDYRKVFWLVDSMSKAFLQRMEKEKLAGKELIREYGVYVKAVSYTHLGVKLPVRQHQGAVLHVLHEDGAVVLSLIHIYTGKRREAAIHCMP